jgi:hypothetical protein
VQAYHASYIYLGILLNLEVDVDGYEVARFEESIHITQIESNLWAITGKPTMKSMLISSHFHSGILSGSNSPTYFI